jgi:transcriptional regulator with XRE-family HTH domain
MKKENNSDKLEYYFGNNLKKLRKGKKLTLLQLAEILNISKSAISDYENAKSIPSIDVIIDICAFFEVKFEDLCNSEKMEFIKKSKIIGPYDAIFENEKYNLHLNLLHQKVESTHLQMQLLRQVIKSKDAENDTLRINIHLLEQKVKELTS